MNNIIDEEQISKNLEKLKLYARCEEINFDLLKTALLNIKYNYRTNNTDKIVNIGFELESKMNSIKEIHNNNINTLNKNLYNYKNTKVLVENMFNNINY